MKIGQTRAAYDLVIVGGGVTGAGVFFRASAMGLNPLLVEARDFAWGTSSRSSKMIHGGLRYLKEGKFLLTRAAVRERQRLLSAYPGLVTPLEFIMPLYKGMGPSRTAVRAGLSIYSFMAGNRQHTLLDLDSTLKAIPGVEQKALVSSAGFRDAQVDDARLVLRLIFDGCDFGGHALNYTRASSFERDSKGKLAAVRIEDQETGVQKEVKTGVVINATGVFAQNLHPLPDKRFRVRPLRGSHLIFPGHWLALDRVLSFIHPRDSRPVFIFPWEGCLVLGTTDVDENGSLGADPAITRQEASYLMEGLNFILPDLGIGPDNAIASLAGVRPVLSRGGKRASKESREHLVWRDKGLVTVAGGKLTTFDLLAEDALKAAGPWLPRPKAPGGGRVSFPATSERWSDFDRGDWLRLCGRYGQRADGVLKNVYQKKITGGTAPVRVASTRTLWAELVYGAKFEQIRHLEDLLLRRVRIGLTLPKGGMEIMDRIRAQTQPVLGWDHERWEKEIRTYGHLWERAYSPSPWKGKNGG